jgi:hypothetical protein
LLLPATTTPGSHHPLFFSAWPVALPWQGGWECALTGHHVDGTGAGDHGAGWLKRRNKEQGHDSPPGMY